jgi:hypothetical protein
MLSGKVKNGTASRERSKARELTMFCKTDNEEGSKDVIQQSNIKRVSGIEMVVIC